MVAAPRARVQLVRGPVRNGDRVRPFNGIVRQLEMSEMTTAAFLEVVLRASDEPTTYLGRDEIEDPLHDALLQAGLGEVTGGGTGPDCSIIDVEVTDLAQGLALVREVLVRLGVPRNTTINQYQPKRVVHNVYGETA